MLFRVLGTVDFISDDGDRETINSRRKRALLATLLLSGNDWIPTDRIIESIWGDRAPKSAYGSLKTYVWQLRTTLAAHRNTRDPIETGAGGYRVALDRDELDMHLFEDHVQAGLKALRDGKSEQAASQFERGCALWRSTPLTELDSEAARIQSDQLAEIRLTAHHGWGRALLGLGANAQAIARLRPAVAEYPFDERLRELLMLALYRAGRQTDALALFEQTRSMLSTELGLDPGIGLRTLRQRIIEHSPALLDGIPPDRPEIDQAPAVFIK